MLVALLNLSSLCLVIVVWLFLTVSWGCLQFMIVVFPDLTHLLFFNNELSNNILLISTLFDVNTFAAKHLKKPIPHCQACFKDS